MKFIKLFFSPDSLQFDSTLEIFICKQKMNYLKLKYNKCFFCTKNYNLVDLTDMNNNAVLINDESVEFRDLVLDVCSVAVSLKVLLN